MNRGIESVATHTCKPGYQLQGGETRICRDDGWSGQDVTCGECILNFVSFLEDVCFVVHGLSSQ